MKTNLLGPCNIYCGNCAIFKAGKCQGCSEESKRAKTEDKVFCDIFACARNQQLSTCSDCSNYPCGKYDKSNFSESFVEWIRKKLKQ